MKRVREEVKRLMERLDELDRSQPPAAEDLYSTACYKHSPFTAAVKRASSDLSHELLRLRNPS